jgi:hypothetical protein
MLPLLLATSQAYGQAPSEVTAPASKGSNSALAAQRFEVGARLSVSPSGEVSDGDESLKVFTGLSGTYAIIPHLAIGVELEQMFAPQNNDHDCQSCMSAGTQTLALIEFRMPVGTEFVRLFGRFAAGHAFVARLDGDYSILPASKASVGFDIRYWHLYARPFGHLSVINEVAAQLGFGLETGATF